MATAYVPVEIWTMILRSTIPFKASSKNSLIAFAQCSRSCRDLSYRILFEELNFFPFVPYEEPKVASKCLRWFKTLLENATIFPFVKRLTFACREAYPFPTLNRFIGVLDAFTNLRRLSLVFVTVTQVTMERLLIALAGRQQKLDRLSFKRLISEGTWLAKVVKEGEKFVKAKGDDQTILVDKVGWHRNSGCRQPYHFFSPTTLKSLSLYYDAEDKCLKQVLTTSFFPSLEIFKLVMYDPGDVDPKVATFLENHRSIQRLKLDTSLQNFLLSRSALPNLLMVRGSFKVLEQLIPGRPVKEVEWNGDLEEDGDNETEYQEEWGTFPELLSRSTALPIQHISFPARAFYEEQLHSLLIRTLEVSPKLESLEVFFLCRDYREVFKYPLPSLTKLRVFKMNMGWDHDVGIDDDAARKEVFDYFKNTTRCPLEQFIWVGLRRLELNKVGNKDWVVVDNSRPDWESEDESEGHEDDWEDEEDSVNDSEGVGTGDSSDGMDNGSDGTDPED